MSVPGSSVGLLTQEENILYQIDDHFVDVVREMPYPGIMTVRASSEEALAPFKDMTLGEIVQVPHHIYTHIVHVPTPVLETTFDWKDLSKTEFVERLTPEPAAFGYEYAWDDEDGKAWGEYGFCWPHEIQSTMKNILEGERNILGDPAFMPLFYIPRELVGGPLPFDLDGDVEITFGEPEEE